MKKVSSCILKGIRYLSFQVVVPNMIWIAIISVPSEIIALALWFRAVNSAVLNGSISISDLVLLIACLVICILVLLCDVVFLIYYRTHRHALKTLTHVKSDYRITNCHYEFYFKDRVHIEQRQEITIVSLNDKLSHFEHSMNWSGKGYNGSKLTYGANHGAKLTEEVRDSSPYIVKIDFPEAIKYNAEETYGFTTELEDNEKSMIPFLSKSVKYPTDKLTLKLTAPRGLLNNVHSCISPDSLGTPEVASPVKVEKETVGDLETFTAVFDNVVLFCCHSIRWEFNS